MSGPGPADGQGGPGGPLTLWLLRHAKASPSGPSDHERPLAPRGRSDAEALGHRLADPGFADGDRPALVLCSTATRTVETVERALAGLADPPPVEYQDALYGATPEGVLAQLRQVDDEIRSLMVVGHNPTAQDLAAAMGRKPPRDRLFPTCALAVYRLRVDHWVEVDRGKGKLVGIFTPPY